MKLSCYRLSVASVAWLGSFGLLGCGTELDSAFDSEGTDGNQIGAEELGVAESQLVGGTATNVRPAIGWLSAGCTATLVDSRYVVTAAHCFGGVSGPRNDTFTIRNTSGAVVANVAVDRAYAYGQNSASSTDIAFGRLATAVPTATAIPIGFGATPTANAQVAAFGFGCTSRSTGAGGGSKQFVNYTYGGSTLNCPGDSGGPRVHGLNTGSGTIWGINSGYTGSGSDITADAASLGPVVLRAVKAFGGTTVTNSTVGDFAEWATRAGAKAVAGDFNADGRGDVALVGGSGWGTVPVAFGNGVGGFTVTNTALASFPGWASSARSAVAGDFDGDGDTDIALVGGSGWATIPVAFSNRNGTFTVTNLQTPNIPAWSQTSGAYAVGGDFDGDGDGDIALVGGAGWGTIPVAFSNRNGTFTQTNTAVAAFPGHARASGSRAIVADFDGDGDSDIALSGGSGWATIPVAFSNRNGGFSATNTNVSDFPAWAQSPGVKLVAGDFDGDGDGDVAALGGTGWRTVAFALSNRSGGFAAANFPLADFPAWAGSARFVLAASVNTELTTNNTTDLILAGGSGWASMPTARLSR